MKTGYVTTAASLAGAVLLVQAAHMVEHVAQVIQKFGLRMSEAHGLLGSIFDFEWVHFVYNTTLEIALVTVAVWWRRGGLPVPRALGFLMILQGYHVIEHIVKMIQYYAIGTPAPKGLIGMVVPVIWLHFWLNLVVLGLIGASWLALRTRESQVRVPAG